MNLLDRKKEMVDTLNKTKSYLNRLEKYINQLSKSKESLINEINNSINPENSMALFYFYYEKDLDLIEPNDYYVNYYYDYRTEQIYTITSKSKPNNNYPNAIDISMYFIDSEYNEEKFKEIINTFINNIIEKHNVENWDTLENLVKEYINNGKFEVAIKNFTLKK